MPTEHSAGAYAIETSVLARLLGIKLLTLEGVVLVSPVQVRATTAAVQRWSNVDLVPAEHGDALRRSPQIGVTGHHSDGSVNGRGGGTVDARTGSQLDVVAKMLDECSAELRDLFWT